MKTKSILLMVLMLMIGLPLMGLWVSGKSVLQYLEFPPITRYVVHEAFSLPVFAVFVVIDGGLFFSLGFKIAKTIEKPGLKIKTYSVLKEGIRRMPWWGLLGMGVAGVSWVIAWNRFSWAHSIQKHTFIFLWVGYILIVNGLCVVKTSACPMLTEKIRFWFLFPLSAVFWWFFEYLNRFVQNWHYTGIEGFSLFAYVVFASVSFSTVLPAVYSTHYLIHSYFPEGSKMSPKYSLNIKTVWRWVILAISSASLFFLGIFPNILFPFLWVSPFLLILSLGTLVFETHDFVMRKTEILSGALSALICGVFWEMWNYYSLAKWEYAIPYVDKYRIFEMPVLGYGGYLPFGLECIVICNLILGRRGK